MVNSHDTLYGYNNNPHFTDGEIKLKDSELPLGQCKCWASYPGLSEAVSVPYAFSQHKLADRLPCTATAGANKIVSSLMELTGCLRSTNNPKSSLLGIKSQLLASIS